MTDFSSDENFDMSKPYEGHLEDWFEYRHPGAIGLGLGYVVSGSLHYGTRPPVHGITTAYVLKRDNEDIETSNARYSLGKPKEK